MAGSVHRGDYTADHQADVLVGGVEAMEEQNTAQEIPNEQGKQAGVLMRLGKTVGAVDASTRHPIKGLINFSLTAVWCYGS